MRVTSYGHSCFLLNTPSHRLLIDPYLSGNDHAPIEPDAVDCDFILLSHGHDDHVGDTASIAARTGATIIANFEIAEYFLAHGLRASGLNPGGGAAFPFGRCKLTLAHHTSSFGPAKHPIYMGAACGILIESADRKIYHAGDTGLFLDMQVIGRVGLDLALLPIGDRYTMGPEDAVEALDLLRPRLTVPMHYSTWPEIDQDPAAFADAANVRGHRVQVLRPGESIDL
ncbi:MAG TPA: metal-dependent hydrolase [Candidatus Synoicihabitans sp.]|nr:metal-dependent hydrolase [Candidatus Synoicihabitans sp.]